MLFSSLAPLLPHFQEKYGMSALGAGVLSGAYTAGMLVGTLLAGLWLNDRFGVRPTALAGCVLLAGASLAFGAAGNVWQLDLARSIQGAGAGILWCALLNWLILVVPSAQRGSALGSAMGAAVLGTAAGPILGIATQVVGTFAVFAAVAATAVALGVVLAEVQAPGGRVRAPGESAIDNLRVPSREQLRGVAAVSFIPPVIGGAVITLCPLDISHLGGSDFAVAMTLLAASLVAAVACPLAGRYADRTGDRPPMLVGSAISCLALLAMAAVSGPLELAIGFVTYQGVALSLAWIPLMSLFSSRAELAGMSATGAAIFLNLTISAGYTAGPLLATALTDVGGRGAPFLLMAAFSFVMTAAILLWSGFAAGYARHGVPAGEASA